MTLPEMTLEELREQIDVLDRQLVSLLNERARAARMVGHLKAATSLPVYEPKREEIVYANVREANQGPLPDAELQYIYERIIDVMRALQRDELASERHARGLKEDLPSSPAGPVAGPAAGLAEGASGSGSKAPSGTGKSKDPRHAGEGNRGTD